MLSHIASVAGAGVGLYTSWGVPAQNSILVASLFYWLIKISTRYTLKAAIPETL
ncbi:hypothetical protein DAQ1742_01827 [Dickeya aquatica]|uniref:Uncharacterized protein n=1 Tax=Dickeya aquatica TaxID=1401087 RepID=A0A375A9J0_9GAMM|nr:hypothetical protein DAQ1742_01827 [Dickeya aquatica]